jgi:hypothetical protein
VRLREGPPLDAIVAETVRRLLPAYRNDVSALASSVCMSERQLHRRCEERRRADARDPLPRRRGAPRCLHDNTIEALHRQIKTIKTRGHFPTEAAARQGPPIAKTITYTIASAQPVPVALAATFSDPDGNPAPAGCSRTGR